MGLDFVYVYCNCYTIGQPESEAPMKKMLDGDEGIPIPPHIFPWGTSAKS